MQPDASIALITILIVAVCIQTLKVIIDISRTRTFRVSYLRSSGWFPSFHAAVTASVVTIIYIEQWLSLLFVTTLIFAGLLRYDAINVRYESGKHASQLNHIHHQLIDVLSKGVVTPTLKERIGHTLPELLAGIILGGCLTRFIYHTLIGWTVL
jgi:acid phosphatase family membrane protein YuiD